MGAIAVSKEEERRIERLRKALGIPTKSGLIRVALATLERRTEEERLRREIADSVRRCAEADRRGPSRHTNWPWSTASDTRSTAVKSPKRLVTPITSRSGSWAMRLRVEERPTRYHSWNGARHPRRSGSWSSARPIGAEELVGRVRVERSPTVRKVSRTSSGKKWLRTRRRGRSTKGFFVPRSHRFPYRASTAAWRPSIPGSASSATVWPLCVPRTLVRSFGRYRPRGRRAPTRRDRACGCLGSTCGRCLPVSAGYRRRRSLECRGSRPCR